MRAFHASCYSDNRLTDQVTQLISGEQQAISQEKLDIELALQRKNFMLVCMWMGEVKVNE